LRQCLRQVFVQCWTMNKFVGCLTLFLDLIPATMIMQQVATFHSLCPSVSLYVCLSVCLSVCLLDNISCRFTSCGDQLVEWFTFYLHDAVSAVLATATCLAGWVLAGCPTHAGIVSKWLNLSENFFNHLKAPSF